LGRPGFTEPWRERYFLGEPLRIGNQLQILMDDYVVEGRVGLERIVGPVTKPETGPLDPGPPLPYEQELRLLSTVEVADLPDPSFDVVGNTGMQLRFVVYDPWEKLYKGYYYLRHYATGRKQPGDTSTNRSTFYAESKDGIHWTKPELDFYRINGKRTNTVLRNDNGGTFQMQDVRVDVEATDPNRRFVALAKTVPPGERTRCIVRLYSSDGRKWDWMDDAILARGASDGAYNPIYDPDRNRWLLYRRPPTTTMARRGPGLYHGANNKRLLAVSVSMDEKTWTYPRSIPILHEIDDADARSSDLGLHKGAKLGNHMDIDDISGVIYHSASRMFFGVLGLMGNHGPTPRSVHLMWSRDGLRWEMLPHRPPFIPNGGPGEWDAGRIAHINILPDGDNKNGLRLYYYADSVPQYEARLPNHGASGVAFIGRDRFIGLRAGLAGGYMLTRQFILEGDRVEINCRSEVKHPAPGLGALIQAELLQPGVEQHSAEAYPGFALADCDEKAITDDYEHVLTWNGSSDLSALRGKEVYIRFYIRNATLYTFRIATG